MTPRKHPLTHELCVALMATLIPACADVEGAQRELERELEHAPELEPERASQPPTPELLASAADASIQEQPDASTADGDAGARCEADWECGASAYCSRQSQRCTARCQGDTCVGPSFARDNDRLVSDGRRVCFADDSDVPGEYALRLWDGSAAQASTLTRAMGARALLLDDGYCYFHAAGALRRAGLNGGCVELVQAMTAAPQRIWRAGDHVLWVAGEGAQAETQRIASAQNAKPEPATNAIVAPPPPQAESVRLQGRVVERDRALGRLMARPETP